MLLTVVGPDMQQELQSKSSTSPVLSLMSDTHLLPT